MVPTDPTLCQKCSIARHDQLLEYLPEEGFFPFRNEPSRVCFFACAPWLVQLYDYAVLISAPSARSLTRVTPTSRHQIPSNKNILTVTGSHFCILKNNDTQDFKDLFQVVAAASYEEPTIRFKVQESMVPRITSSDFHRECWRPTVSWLNHTKLSQRFVWIFWTFLREICNTEFTRDLF